MYRFKMMIDFNTQVLMKPSHIILFLEKAELLGKDRLAGSVISGIASDYLKLTVNGLESRLIGL